MTKIDHRRREKFDSSIVDEDDTTAGSIKSTTLTNRFLYSEIHDYLLSQKYPLGFTKADKLT